MPNAKERAQHRRWLVTLTGTPTAAGREGRVIEWVRGWVAERSDLKLRRDGAGNLVITHRRRSEARPLYITAHLDHPAFVVRRRDGRDVELEFRGGVHDPYFEDARIEIIDADDAAHRGAIVELDPGAKPFKRVICRLARAAAGVAAGDIGRWAFSGRGPRPGITGGVLHAHACDDLAGVAAALSALDVLRGRADMGHVGVLLTRAEEVGFLGAVAACRRRTVARRSRLICLENSRSFAESPIGGGPILRVGDKASVFSPDLTNRLAALMDEYVRAHPGFTSQRKLMPGGTCEASTFSAWGFESTCVCLPLGNYHNMVDIGAVLAGKRPARVGPEHISIADFHGMVELLVHFAKRLDDPRVPGLRERMEERFARLAQVLE